MDPEFIPAATGLVNFLACIILMIIGAIGVLLIAASIKIITRFFEFLRDEGFFEVILDDCERAYHWFKKKFGE